MRLYDTVEIPEYLLERLDECIDALQRTYDRIDKPGELQPGQVIIIRVKEARKL